MSKLGMEEVIESIPNGIPDNTGLYKYINPIVDHSICIKHKILVRICKH